ncbi:transposase [Salipiger sp. 1_MG-2023]|uniref:IS66 family transposase n=1 Tax=Salipiger sp. 1_MG-2023 TaxID=3062665 RepID=UPI0026E365C8|nr:transposase [Salipiger sp. 1_MG-2023]MDO6587963.1 transposase [Salipiger sp. 1_MG-2023]
MIGEGTSERLDTIPAQFRVIVTRRPNYACRSREAVLFQASAKPRLIEGGKPTEATMASVIVSKFADHLPLYRQIQIYARQGGDPDRSTLAAWVGKAADELPCLRLPAGELQTIRQALHALSADCYAIACRVTDETTAPVFDPGRGKVKKGYFWALARDV